MSVEAITWALAQQIKPSSMKFVLVALANCASSDSWKAYPSVQYLADATGQDRKTVLANISKLKDLGVLEDTGERKGGTNQVIVYRLNCTEIGTVKQSQKRNSTENGTVPFFRGKSTVFPYKQSQNSLETVPKTVHGTVINHQGTVIEPSNTRAKKKTVDVEIPEWLDKQLWQSWIDHRKKIRKPMTDNAMKLLIRDLAKFRDGGYPPQTVIEQSIKRGWTALFEPSDGSRQTKQTKPSAAATFKGKNYAGTAADQLPGFLRGLGNEQ